MIHKPVLLQEIKEFLNVPPGAVVVDGTLGSGGHAQAFLECLGATGRLIGLDQDPEAITRCRRKFDGDDRVILVHRNFREIKEVLKDLNLMKVDAVLLDIGMSSDQLANEKRGFSFQREGDLDMRMNTAEGEKASYYLQTLPEKEIARVLYEFGEERQSRRIAAAIVRERRLAPIQTTQRLCEVVENSFPQARQFEKGKRPVWNRRHPATKVFQALRILVNDELGALREGIDGAMSCLKPGGKLGVISFHSIEDRIVKEKFRDFVREGSGKPVNRKPLVAKRSEVIDNPRSRSAKLRVIEVVS